MNKIFLKTRLNTEVFIEMMFSHRSICFFGFLIVMSIKVSAGTIEDENYISTSKQKGCFSLVSEGRSASLLVDVNEHKGVVRALKDLKTDIFKVTGKEPSMVYNGLSTQSQMVIVGTLGKSRLIADLIEKGKLNVDEIQGKWEHFLIQVVNNPFPGVERAMLIVGSDKRGTIYGIYDVSQKIGVSPWYYWADVSVDKKEALYVKTGRYIQGPSVKYRGIFINDEAPALSNWIKEKYGTVKPSFSLPVHDGVANYNHVFYENIFELLLRLKANYLWPAMWDNAFNEDDSENPRLADEYGIVMGTSHQEPMMRAQKEWDRKYYKSLGHWNYTKHPDSLVSFWRKGIRRNKNFENIVTMGLRGANDTEINGSVEKNIAMIEAIVNTQREILSEEINPELDKVPQMWCLYKEIMDYYNLGMKVPEDITLLWSDDNWGNLRRLPSVEEQDRKGGAGVYYHFDYHGGPRSYQWINTSPIAKIWDQMTLAKQYGADRIWIVNVGSFKGLELPMEYFMDLAWDTDKWTHANINDYTKTWAQNLFGEKYGVEIASILSKYTKFNGRRKPESLSPQTYSLVNYNEAENVVNEFNEITLLAEEIYKKLPKEKRAAFYQIVLFPTKVSALVNELYFTAAKNELYAKQERASTNKMYWRTQELFKEDSALMDYYNGEFMDGKWSHFMDQAHLGYTSWNPPAKNSLKHLNLKEINIKNKALLGVSVEGSALCWPLTSEVAVLPMFDTYGNSKHYIELFNRGNIEFEYSITSNVPWLKFKEAEGLIKGEDKRIWFYLDPNILKEGTQEGLLTIFGAGEKIQVKVQAFIANDKKEVKGFVESVGVVAIEAAHFSKNKKNGNRKWIEVTDYGLTLSGMRATAPANALPAIPEVSAACLEYPIHTFSCGEATLTLVTSPQLNFMPDRPIRIAVSMDEEAPIMLTVVPDGYKVHHSNPDWGKTVVNQSRHIQTELQIKNPGNHVLKIWMIDPGVIVQKIILDMGGLKNSYMGPPESFYKTNTTNHNNSKS